MPAENDLSRALAITEGSSSYDEAAKRLLSQKVILAYIMKECIPEYRDCTIDEIADRYIEGKPQVGDAAVHLDEENAKSFSLPYEVPERIEGMNTEDSTVTEGTVRYDIRFKSRLPQAPEKLYMILNVEAQDFSQVRYPLLKRAVYYGSRLISSQYGTVFTGMNYGELKKVYSIWICTKVSKRYRGSMNRYEMTERHIEGEKKECPKNYALMNLIVIYVGRQKEETQEGVLGLLEVLLSEERSAGEKKRILQEEYHIAMTREMDEEVSRMCNLGQGIYEEGRKKGRREGRKEGRKEGRREGHQEGVREGRRESQMRICQNLWRIGMPEEAIAKVIEGDVSEIRGWIKGLSLEECSVE